jgi:hypothetical protein
MLFRIISHQHTNPNKLNHNMKIAKTIAAAGLFLLTFSTAADAQTYIRLTGSTAFRANTHNAIRNIMATGHTFAYTGTSLGSANQSIFQGTYNGNPVIIKCSWSGSVDGTNTVSNSVNIAFLPDSVVGTAAGQSGITAVTTSTTPGTAVDISAPNVGMADTFQSSTRFNTNPLTETRVGVIGFQWMVNRGLSRLTITVNTVSGSNEYFTSSTASLAVGMTVTGTNIPTGSKIGQILDSTRFTLVDALAGSVANKNATVTSSGNSCAAVSPAPFNNVTPQLLQALFLNGSLPLALFTGNPTDETVNVYATGRDPGSGTRLTAFAETGIGVNSSIVQYLPTISSGSVASHVPWPAGTFNGIPFSTGNGGQTSGGNLVSSLTSTTSAINGYYVSYVSVNDAATAVASGAKELTYNGTAYSLDRIRNGQYPFWSYQFVTYRSSIPTAEKTVADALASQIITTDSPVLLSSMRVGRTQDGGLITPNY